MSNGNRRALVWAWMAAGLAAAAAQPSHGGNRIFASPLARRIAQQKGIDLAALSGTGPRGRIVKSGGADLALELEQGGYERVVEAA